MRATIPNAGTLPRPWLWQVWAAVCVAFVIALAAHFLFRAPLALSSPTYLILGDTCTVSSDATNNTNQRVEASLVFIIGIGTRPSKSSPGHYADIARRTVSVVLAPGESRAVSCEFALTQHRPNTARVEIVASNIPN